MAEPSVDESADGECDLGDPLVVADKGAHDGAIGNHIEMVALHVVNYLGGQLGLDVGDLGELEGSVLFQGSELHAGLQLCGVDDLGAVVGTSLEVLKDEESVVCGNADLLTVLEGSSYLDNGLSLLVVSDPVADFLLDELALVILGEHEVSILDVGDLHLLSLAILINLDNEGISSEAA